jgi:hypothetical protein
VTTTRKHQAQTKHTTIAGRGIAARIRAVGEKVSGRMHAVADDCARALGWEVIQTPCRLGLSARSCRDPRFAARRWTLQDTGPDG